MARTSRLNGRVKGVAPRSTLAKGSRDPRLVDLDEGVEDTAIRSTPAEGSSSRVLVKNKQIEGTVPHLTSLLQPSARAQWRRPTEPVLPAPPIRRHGEGTWYTGGSVGGDKEKGSESVSFISTDLIQEHPTNRHATTPTWSTGLDPPLSPARPPMFGVE